MDYRKNTAAQQTVRRTRKYDTYVRQGTQTTHRRALSAAPANDLFDRFRRAPSEAVTKPSQIVKRSSVISRQPSGPFTSPNTAKVAEKTAYQPVSIAHQAALFAVHQAKASHQDMLSEQFAGSYQEVSSSRRKLSKAQKLFYGVGSLVFLFALAVSVQGVLTNRDAKQQLGVLGAQTQMPDEYGVPEGSGDEPAEAEVPKAAMTAYKVSPELPRYLRIPALGVVARIKHTGITKDGAIDAPANINDVSWYNQSAKPGSEMGTSLLMGHVSGWTAPGIFKKINQMKPGTQFEIEMGSGEKNTYEVTRGESIPLDVLNMGKVLTPEVPGEHDLKLMTCSGRFNREADHYEERYVVYAKIVR